MIKNCRLCGSKALTECLDLGFHPLADTFLRKDENEYSERFYRLTVVKCEACEGVQTGHRTSPEERYQEYEYSYDSMNSPVSVTHFKDLHAYCESLFSSRERVQERMRVLEIGSNIGTLLRFFKEESWDVLGVDPAANIAAIARDQYGIETVGALFDSQTAVDIKNKYGYFDLICGSNVFNHIDELEVVFSAIASMLQKDGQFVFEVPYLKSLIESSAFDTIYHEHVHYHSVKSLNTVLARSGLYIKNIELVDYMCGSLRVACDTVPIHSQNVKDWIDKEERSELFSYKIWEEFDQKINIMRDRIRAHVALEKKSGKRIIAVGAATKGNTLLNFCGLTRRDIDFAVDNSSLKIGKLMPGSRIPIKSDDALTECKGALAIILPWNISEFLKKKLNPYQLDWIDVQEYLKS